jgi:hypothetical protein
MRRTRGKSSILKEMLDKGELAPVGEMSDISIGEAQFSGK